MAAVAGIGSAELNAEIRSRYSKTVIRPIVIAHVSATRHVALRTLSTATDFKQHLALSRPNGISLLTFLFVKMMLPGVIDPRAVALQT